MLCFYMSTVLCCEIRVCVCHVFLNTESSAHFGASNSLHSFWLRGNLWGDASGCCKTVDKAELTAKKDS